MSEVANTMNNIVDEALRFKTIFECIERNIKTKDEWERLLKLLQGAVNKK